MDGRPNSVDVGTESKWPAERIAAGPLGEVKRARAMFQDDGTLRPGDEWKVRSYLNGAIRMLQDPEIVARLASDLLDMEDDR